MAWLVVVVLTIVAAAAAVGGGAFATAGGGPLLLWPQPQSVSLGATTRQVSPAFSFKAQHSSADLQEAFDRYTALIFTHRVKGELGDAPLLNALSVQVHNLTAPLQLGTDESYRLSVPVVGDASLEAETYYGALKGLETFSQLVQYNFSASTYGISQTPWVIKDSPRFPHRGVLVDTSRHFEPMAMLRRIIDSLSYAKFNVLHWHITDIQSFPFQSAKLPRFTMAAYSMSERFSPEDVQDLVEYARKRGVRVMMEIDVPGHAGSWCAGYPEVCPSPQCNMPLDPSSNATWTIMRTLLEELISLVPEGLFHLGGDEVDMSCWTSVPHVAQWIKAHTTDNLGAYRYFVNQAHTMVQAKGRTPINWDEVYANFGTTISNDTIIHVWRNEAYVQNATRDGFRVLVSPDGPWYLDGLSTTWQQMYALEPANGITNHAQAARILGGEACMWGETVDASVIMPTIWPRAAAVAERLWSDVSVNNATTAEPRYAWFRCLLDQRGIEAGPSKNTQARTAPSGPGSCYAQ
eukprot:TRINITY_DN6880_c2_g1_i1.p1 TRINITY_DN6880_c2_g1~~TRINITY_DN6880_c2_g1_i1.p1  ORF type:complete len:528 (-),score=69.30 TRINITY_DN6880_c2_g1_i1:46-1605(-)